MSTTPWRRSRPGYTRVDMAETVEARRQRYAHRHDDPGSGGMPLGLPLIDAHTRGVLPGELVALAAYTKIGKTFLMLPGRARRPPCRATPR